MSGGLAETCEVCPSPSPEFHLATWAVGLYASTTKSLQDLLCVYFDATGCLRETGKTVSPVGGTADGGKVLKVRQAIPGQGKSGGLRLQLVAYCKDRRVVVVGATLRKNA